MKRMYYRTKTRKAWEKDGEVWVGVHPKTRCAGEHCVVHNPSDHCMVDFPRHLRETGLVERICPHGIGHPDPDSLVFMHASYMTHGCDGCCRPEGIKMTKEGLDCHEADYWTCA